MGVGKRLRINNHLLEKKNVRLSAVNLIDFLYHKQARVVAGTVADFWKTNNCRRSRLPIYYIS